MDTVRTPSSQQLTAGRTAIPTGGDGTDLQHRDSFRAARHQLPSVCYLVLIESAAQDGRLRCPYLASRQPVAEFDAGAAEVQLVLRDLTPSSGSTRSGSEASLSVMPAYA
jgi:hypothetical protein